MNPDSDESRPLQISQDEQDLETERGRERTDEDQRFVPVIIKRTDERRRHPDDALDRRRSKLAWNSSNGHHSLFFSRQ